MTAERDPLAVFSPGVFSDTTALVTGGGRGIGRSIALAFAHLGADVVIASRNPENLEPAAAEIAATGVACLAVPTDIRDVDQVESLLKQAGERFGGIDFLINNAGGQFPARPNEISDRGWRAVIDLNLNGTWNMCSRVGPHMVERGFGAIVNVVHVYSFERGSAPFVHSGAARAGVVNMTRSLAQYWAKDGVTVNALAPGFVATDGLKEELLKGGDFETLAESDIPAGRLAETDEIAAAVLFLCSPGARYINGTTLTADGGLYLANWTPWWDPESS
jgi:NAD(P)-dependent dehydrogenase (short-subunit alcohol dehydrogenase family)